MTREDLEVLAGFAAVWARVQGEQAEQCEAAGESQLEQTLKRLHTLWCGYRRMSAAARGEMKYCLQMLSNRTQGLVRLLHLEFFLKTGELHISENDGKFASCTLLNLRKLWQCTVEMQELMQHENAALRRVGEEMRSQSQVLERLILRCLP